MTDEQIEELMLEIEHEYDCGQAKAMRAVYDREFCVKSRGFQIVGYDDKGGRIESLLDWPEGNDPYELKASDIRRAIEDAQKAGAAGTCIQGGFDIIPDCDDEDEAQELFKAMAYEPFEVSFFEVTLWERNPKPTKFPIS